MGRRQKAQTPKSRSAKLLARLRGYVGRHHLMVLAVFFAITGGAYAVEGEMIPTYHPREPQWDAKIHGQRGSKTVPGEVLHPQFLSEPPKPTSKQIRASEESMRMARNAWLKFKPPHSGDQPSGDVVPPTPGTESDPVSRARAINDFTIWRNTTLAPANSHSINEPSVSQSGKNVFYTGNRYAARSVNGGQTWTYVDPFADFPNFCCDQDTVYDPTRDTHIWYRQGNKPTTATGTNSFKLSSSRDGGATWCTHTVSPPDIDPAFANTWFDYPRLHLTNNYLYITTNLFNSGVNTANRRVLLRYSLSTLASSTCTSALSADWYFSSTTGYSWSGVEGASDTFFLGDTIDADDGTGNGTFRLYQIVRGSRTATAIDRTIPAWTETFGTNPDNTASCPGPSGPDPCTFSDQRVLAGWVRTVGGVREVGFMWNVAEGDGFLKPYVNAATFQGGSLSYASRPYLFSNNAAYQYPYVAPDGRDNLGLNVSYFTSSAFPAQVVGIDDDFNSLPPPWADLLFANSGTGGPETARWGDYARVRAFQPDPIAWVASGYTEQTGSGNAQPHYTVFGRARDVRGVQRWWNK